MRVACQRISRSSLRGFEEQPRKGDFCERHVWGFTDEEVVEPGEWIDDWPVSWQEANRR